MSRNCFLFIFTLFIIGAAQAQPNMHNKPFDVKGGFITIDGGQTVGVIKAALKDYEINLVREGIILRDCKQGSYKIKQIRYYSILENKPQGASNTSIDNGRSSRPPKVYELQGFKCFDSMGGQYSPVVVKGSLSMVDGGYFIGIIKTTEGKTFEITDQSANVQMRECSSGEYLVVKQRRSIRPHYSSVFEEDAAIEEAATSLRTSARMPIWYPQGPKMYKLIQIMSCEAAKVVFNTGTFDLYEIDDSLMPGMAECTLATVLSLDHAKVNGAVAFLKEEIRNCTFERMAKRNDRFYMLKDAPTVDRCGVRTYTATRMSKSDTYHIRIRDYRNANKCRTNGINRQRRMDITETNVMTGDKIEKASWIYPLHTMDF